MTEDLSKDDIIQAAREIQATYPEEWKIRLGQVIYNEFLFEEEQDLVVGTDLDPFQSNEIPHETLDWLIKRRATDQRPLLTQVQEDQSIREDVDPYNLSGRDPTQSVWKDGKRPSPDYYIILNGKTND